MNAPKLSLRLGKPTDSAFVERLNGELRAERLNASWFLGLEDAGSEFEARDYNEVKSHDSIGHKGPTDFARAFAQTCPPKD